MACTPDKIPARPGSGCPYTFSSSPSATMGCLSAGNALTKSGSGGNSLDLKEKSNTSAKTKWIILSAHGQSPSGSEQWQSVSWGL